MLFPLLTCLLWIDICTAADGFVMCSVLYYTVASIEERHLHDQSDEPNIVTEEREDHRDVCAAETLPLPLTNHRLAV